jgi:dolichol-phosphate mannosyltransferase
VVSNAGDASSSGGIPGDGVTYSFVIPVFNEIDNLPELTDRLDAVMADLDGPAEVVFVDDGSTDDSYAWLQGLHRRDARVRVVRLSRNFGHQIALTAGLEVAQGRAVVLMDADLQDPPETALELAKWWRDGYDVVHAVRRARPGESRTKRATARWFYRVMRRLGEVEMPLDAGDFRLVDRRVVEAVLAMPEHRRYLRGMFVWVGYKQAAIVYDRAPRHAGRTKFSFGRMLSFAFDGIVSFSAAPLRAVLASGFMIAVASFLLGVAAIVCKLTGVYTTPGWASIAVGIAFLSGVQLAVIGFMGEYVARIYEEVKGRPLYLVRDALGVDTRAVAPDPVGRSETSR